MLLENPAYVGRRWRVAGGGQTLEYRLVPMCDMAVITRNDLASEKTRVGQHALTSTATVDDRYDALHADFHLDLPSGQEHCQAIVSE